MCQYSHDHGRVFHYPSTWSELLDGAGGVQRPGPSEITQVKPGEIRRNKHKQLTVGKK